MDGADPSLRDTLARWRRALRYLRPWRPSVAAIVVLTLLLGALSALEPLVFKALFDAIGAEDGMGRFLLVLAGLGGLTVARELTSGVSTWLTWRARIGVHFALLDDTVGRLHALPMSYHKGESVGSLMTRVERGIQGFVDALSEAAFQIVPSAVYLGIAVAVMLQLDLRLSAVVLALAPLPVLIGVLAAPEQVGRERALLDRWARIYARFNEAMAGIHTVKSFAMEDEERRRFLTEVDAANRLVVRGVRRDTAVGATKNVTVAVARLAALGLGGFLVLRGETTVGTVVAFLTYAGNLFTPVQALTNSYQVLRRATVSLDAVFRILDARLTPADAPEARPLPRPVGDVRFEGVRFDYGEGDGEPVLHGIDLHVHPGETVALVGPSGSGKSTLVSLLQRLYDPTAGRILVDDHDLRDLQQRSLRRHVGVVLQDTLLFNDTVRNNIAYGRPDATMAEIVQAARAANAHAFILRLPRGYDTVVGERGGLLSGGQRQRVAIARALLKDPPILVLDEATSALDAESEAAVQEALERLMRGRTTFVVAHRLSTIADADRIVVLAEGRIEDQGSHARLMARGGYYARLVRLQHRGLDLAG